MLSTLVRSFHWECLYTGILRCLAPWGSIIFNSQHWLLKTHGRERHAVHFKLIKRALIYLSYQRTHIFISILRHKGQIYRKIMYAQYKYCTQFNWIDFCPGENKHTWSQRTRKINPNEVILKWFPQTILISPIFRYAPVRLKTRT